MIVTVADVIAAMERWAPQAYAYEWDRPGLHIGAPNDPVLGVLTCLTVNRAVLEKAEKEGATLILAHHPLIWEPLKALRTDFPQMKLCLDIAAKGMACFSAHTNLDIAPGGVNHVLAEALGLQGCRPLKSAQHLRQWKLVTFVPESHLADVRTAVCDAGAGGMGNYQQCSFSTPGTGTFLPMEGAQPFSGKVGHLSEDPESRFETIFPRARLKAVLKALFKAHPYEEVAYDLIALENRDPDRGIGLRGELADASTLDHFANHVRDALKIDHLRVVGAGKKRVRRVAVLGGAGGGEVAALPPDIDVYVTGDVKYHDAQLAQERGIALIDAGHRGTEKGIVPAMARYLRNEFNKLPIKTYTEPECFRVY
jgi:dinuclear metal center YbgI/SA1388 family protein